MEPEQDRVRVYVHAFPPAEKKRVAEWLQHLHRICVCSDPPCPSIHPCCCRCLCHGHPLLVPYESEPTGPQPILLVHVFVYCPIGGTRMVVGPSLYPWSGVGARPPTPCWRKARRQHAHQVTRHAQPSAVCESQVENRLHRACPTGVLVLLTLGAGYAGLPNGDRSFHASGFQTSASQHREPT